MNRRELAGAPAARARRWCAPVGHTQAHPLAVRPRSPPVPCEDTPPLADLLPAREQDVGPVVIVLDDAHVLSSPAVFEALEALVGSLGDGSQLALASRERLGLRLGRLRARQQLV